MLKNRLSKSGVFWGHPKIMRYLSKKKGVRFLLYSVDLVLDSFIHKDQRLPARIEKILIVNPDHLGDMLLLTSVLPLIKEKYPKAKIDMLCGSWALPVLENNPYIENIFIINHSFANRSDTSRAEKLLEYLKTFIVTLWKIRKESYDLGLFMRSRRGNLALLALLGNIRFSVGYGTAGCGAFFNRRAEWSPGKHETEHFLEVLERIDVLPGARKLKPEIYPLPDDDAILFDLLEPFKEQLTKIAIVHPGAGSHLKTLKPDIWKRVIENLEANGYSVYLTGTLQEESLLISIASPSCVILAGKLTLSQLMLFFKKATLIVTVDSLSSHLSGMSGTKTIVFHCAMNDSVQWRAKGDNVTVLEKRCPTLACERGCAAMACMDFDVTVVNKFL